MLSHLTSGEQSTAIVWMALALAPAFVAMTVRAVGIFRRWSVGQ